MEGLQPDNRDLHIIGYERMANELLYFFLNHAIESDCRCFLNKSFKSFKQSEKKGRKSLVLWDCREFDCHAFRKELHRSMHGAPINGYLTCFNVNPNLGIEKEALDAGVRGIFYLKDTLATLEKGIRAILAGELWYSRTFLSKSLTGYMGNKNTSPALPSSKVDLTRREKEILRELASGSSHVQIADSLCISPLTVKTHVKHIYQKINVPNRVQAMFWASKNPFQLMK